MSSAWGPGVQFLEACPAAASNACARQAGTLKGHHHPPFSICSKKAVENQPSFWNARNRETLCNKEERLPTRQAAHTTVEFAACRQSPRWYMCVCVYISVPGGAKELSRDFLSICLKRSGASVQVLTSEWTAGAGVPASTQHWHLQVYTCMWERAVCENDWTWCPISYLLLTLMDGLIDGWPRCFPRKYCLG